jgi:YVTN family beta-propeller protein|tara:strand:- start:1083 stop:2159 length:1077 start_codon:yes stop_codon:yes gene_type:complete
VKAIVNFLATAWIASGALLLGAPSLHAEPLVYVPLGSESKIAIIDAAKDQIIGIIDGLQAVHGLSGTPDGRFLIAGSYSERSVDITPVKPKSVSEDEHAAHHKAPSVQKEESDIALVSTVSVVQISDGEVVRTIDVPGAVHHVSVSPNGRYTAVTRPNEGGISIIDLTNFEIVGNISTGELPNYSVFSPDNKQLFVSNAGDGTISVINGESWVVEMIIPVGTSPEHIVLSKDGKILYVNNVDDGTVSVVDTILMRETKTMKMGSVLHGIDLSEDGSALFVAALGDDKITKVDLASESLQSVKLSPSPYHLATIAGTDKIYVSSSDEAKIWIVSQKSLELVGQIMIGGKGHQMVVMPGS